MKEQDEESSAKMAAWLLLRHQAIIHATAGVDHIISGWQPGDINKVLIEKCKDKVVITILRERPAVK